jgi:hypothetical protein
MESYQEKLITASRELCRTAAELVQVSRDRIGRGRHDWMGIAPGRVCERCHETQLAGEYGNTVCRPR